MKTRGAAIQGGLAALGLVAAYVTWQREPERAPGEVVVIDAGKDDVTMIRYEDGAKWVEMIPKREDDGPAVWLHISAKPDGKPRPIPERLVRGNEGARKLLDRFTPLHATRALGTLDAAKLKELGLDAPKKKLTITVRGAVRTFGVGTSPFGVSDPYVKDEKDGRVYVLGGGLLGDLDGASTRLVDRTLHTFKPAEYDALTVTASGKTRELVTIGAEQPLNVKLASKKTPTKADDLAKNWHDKVWRLVVTDLLGKDELPSTGTPTVALRIDYQSHGKARGFLELGRVAPAPPTIASMPPQTTPDIFARTEHTPGWAKVPATADELIKEADKVATGE